MPRRLAIDEIVTTEGLEAIAGEWEALWARCPGATPFQSPAWLIPWWRHLGEGKLLSVAVHEGGRLVGLAPLYVYTEPRTAARSLLLLGVATTDYLDALFEPDLAEEAADAVLRHLLERRDAWDAADLTQLRPDSPLLRAPRPVSIPDHLGPSEPCFVLHLNPLRGDLPAAVPARMAQNLRYYQRRAEKHGRLSFEAADDQTWQELYGHLLDLHAARWALRSEPGVLCDERVRRAHRDSLPELLRLGVLRLYGARISGKLVAALYVLADARGPCRRAYDYIGGFDPELSALSPGTLLIGHALQEAVREGCRVFDFLRGNELYKRLWGAHEQPTYRRRLGGLAP
jgi:CelD/BcsL family acetyltransferase involved in cellulose biosynthesis